MQQLWHTLPDGQRLEVVFQEGAEVSAGGQVRIGDIYQCSGQWLRCMHL